ncbi:MAG TPA: energy transducer TonB [Chthoniobacteraceae bacterium]|jgi:protein TonB|nr:energy transducer TonB [Chthoniobacteraceae bacterium]
MKARTAGYFIAAALLHAGLLFGFHMESPAVPLAVDEESAPMDVSLVASAPAAGALAPAASPAATPEPEASPTPEMTPEPEPTPEPTPDMPTPEPTPDMDTPAPTPPPDAMVEATPSRPKPRPVVHHHSHSAPGSSARIAGASAASSRGGPPSHGEAGSGISSQARYLYNPKPDYPEDERRMRHEGVVYLSVEVGADGRAAEVSISRSSGYPQLDDSAARAVRRWTFDPARAGGLPVSSRVEIPVRFSLSSY